MTANMMEQKRISENGIEIYSYPNKNLHSFCISLYVKAGCLYESEEDNGMTHLLEHLVFRNVDRLMGGELYHTLDRLGLTFNASTYKEFVQFIITGAVKHYEEAVRIITKVFEPLALSREQIELEKQRVKAEIREKDYDKSLDCFTEQIIWKGTALTRDIAGKIKYLNQMGKQRLEKGYRQLFSKNNLFFYLTGNISDEMTDYLEKELLRYKIEETEKTRDNEAPVPEDFFNRNCTVDIKNSDFCYVRFSFDVDTSRYENAELDLLYDLLFSGDSCLVYQELSEKTGLIYSFDARFELYRNIGNLHFSYEVRQSNLLKSLEIITQQFRKFKQEMKKELSYVTAPYIDNAYIMFDDADDFNWSFAYENHILDCGYRCLEDRIAAYQKVTKERVKEIACEILRPENLVLTLKGRKKKLSLDEIRKKVMDL